jgi:hypothetical protein
MTTAQTIAICIVIVIGILAMLAYATLWAEPRQYDQPLAEPKALDPITKIDVERL